MFTSILINPQITSSSGDLEGVHLNLTLILDKNNVLTVIDNTKLDWKDFVDCDTVFINHIKPEML